MRNFSTEPEGNNKRQKRMPKPSRSLFVSNVPQYASNEHLREIFSPYGVIDHVYICTSRFLIGALILTSFIDPADQGSHKGCARVDFRKQEDATTVQQSGQAEPFFLMDQALHVDYSTNPCYPKTHVLFFRHFSGNEEDLRAILNDYKDRITEIAFGECCFLSGSEINLTILTVPPFKEGQLWDRGIIVFGNEDSDIAEEVLAKFNGQMTALGCRMDLEYSSMKPRWGTQVPS